MKLHVRASGDVDGPLEQVFDFAVANESLPKILRKTGIIPGIAHAEMIDGAPMKPGAQRRVRMSDNSEILEEIIELQRPNRLRYRWLRPPAAPFNLLVRGGEADWTFSATPKGTTIDWTYAMELTTPLVYPLAAPVLLLFRRWMRNGLAAISGAMGK